MSAWKSTTTQSMMNTNRQSPLFPMVLLFDSECAGLTDIPGTGAYTAVNARRALSGGKVRMELPDSPFTSNALSSLKHRHLH